MVNELRTVNKFYIINELFIASFNQINNSQLRYIRLKGLSVFNSTKYFLRESSSVYSLRRYLSKHTGDLRINRPSDLTRKGRLNIVGYVLIIAFYI
jgi:hypothetical protein